MPFRNKMRIVLWSVLCALVCAGCSTKRNTVATRAYHELTTRYNVYFNAEMAYGETLQSLFQSHQEDFSSLLPMYPNSSIPGDTTVKNLGGPFDKVIEKTAKAIQEHSISTKPVRDAAKMNSQEYRDWLRQNEFNPFIDRAWLLMGKAHVQNRDYAQAIAVLSQTARLFTHDIQTVSEAQIWMLRAYVEMGWFTDAETVVSTLQSRVLPIDLRKLFDEFRTFYLLSKHEYEAAIPFLNETVKTQKDKRQKQRLQFLLGQLYALSGENEKAYRAFEKLKGISISHEVELNALLARSQVADDNAKTISGLTKMAKRGKNADHADQIYYAIGKVHLSQGDEEKAIGNFRSAEEKSTQSVIYKAFAQIAQGDIYFKRKDFAKAQPKYVDALNVFPKTNVLDEKIRFRADVLGELVPHILDVKRQDSLQHLAVLPDEERLKIIDRHIVELKKKVQSEKRSQQLDAFLSQAQSQTVSGNQPAIPISGSDGTFYFYNPQSVAQGKSEFRRIWGNRSLEDNWRLTDKSGSSAAAGSQELDARMEERQSASSSQSDGKTDVYSREYYLRQLPQSADDWRRSNDTIAEGLFQIGRIAQDRLSDFDYATENYNRYLQDFPDGNHRLDIYSRLYLVDWRNGDFATANGYKNIILTEYPDSDIAMKMSDPEYLAVMRDYANAQDLLYQETYQAYKAGDFEMVRRNHEKAVRFFENSSFMPQFKLLNALSYAQTADSVLLKSNLNELAAEFPESAQSELARNILMGLSEGKILASAASAISDFDWSVPPGDFSVSAIDSIGFDAAPDQPYSYLLLFDERKVRENDLLFAISDYNFSNFQTRFFPVSWIKLSRWDAMKIDGFESLNEVRRYAQLIESDSLFAGSITDSIRTLIISRSNIELLNSVKSMEEYLAFYNSEFNLTPSVIGRKEPKSALNDVLDTETPGQPDTESRIVPTAGDLPQKIYQPERKTLHQRQVELERKEAEALGGAENIPSEKEKRQNLKAREKVRKELIKERSNLLKQKEKERQVELKQREQERKQKLKEQERLRKEKLKERNRVLKRQNR